MIKYWCEKCKEYVLIEIGTFKHTHLGDCTSLTCCQCKNMVYPKDEKAKEAT